jgi:peroxiredoxin (alkyl hydroperoxide reductase subunit C)
MPEELKVGCARPAGGPVQKAENGAPGAASPPQAEKEESNVILIGRKAPDFIAPAYHQGKFVNVQLSQYLGRWVLLCFYPGDFTFV